VAINQLSGIASGSLIILANDLDPFRDVAIFAYDESIMPFILGSDAGLACSLQLGAARMRSRPTKCPLPGDSAGEAAGLLLLIGKQVF
jgi:hypothetical protein